MVLGPVMVADNGRAPHGVADENSDEDKVYIHDDTIGRNPVLPGQPHQLEVVKDVHQGHGNVGHQLRGPVEAGVQKDLAVELRLGQPQDGVPAAAEVPQGENASHHLAQRAGRSSPRQSPLKNGDKKRVQGHVGDPGGDHHPQSQLGPLGGDEKALEHVLEHKCR